MNVNMAANLTAIFKLRACTEVRAFCLYVSPKPRGDENTRPGFDNWRSQLDRPGAQRTGCPEGASKASQSPPHRHIQERARTKVRAFVSKPIVFTVIFLMKVRFLTFGCYTKLTIDCVKQPHSPT